MSDRPSDAREKILARLSGWQEPALSREVEAVLSGDRFDECPLQAAGFRVVRLSELGTLILGADNKCLCTTSNDCLNTDKRDGMRCTLEQLRQLNYEAGCRRSRQSGDEW